jgi:hypothetical protein
MRAHLLISMALSITTASALAAERWQEDTFPPPNGGLLVYAVLGDGNPACASYDGANCLWGVGRSQIDFSKVKPLVCGAGHRRLYGVTGFEDPKHWCNLALKERTARKPAPAPAPAPATPPVSGYRLSEWSPWARAAGVDYRYRVGWDPATGGAGQTVDAIYESTRCAIAGTSGGRGRCAHWPADRRRCGAARMSSWAWGRRAR